MTPVSTILGTLRLDPAVFAAVIEESGGVRLGLTVLIAGGASHALGQSVALFANRVRPRRFVLALSVETLLFAGSVTVWALSLALAADMLAGASAPLGTVIAVVGLGHAPRLLGLLALVPYFGSGIGVTLTVWTFLATAVGARAAFGLDLPEALLVLGTAWAITEATRRTIGLPIVAATRWLRRWSSGGRAEHGRRPS